MDDKFAAFILSHGRPDNVLTIGALQRHGYTGKTYIVIDNEDAQAQEYYDKYGKEKVIMFDKKEMAKKFDQVDNFDNRKTIVYARNACFHIANDLGLDNFIQLDDDYYWFGHRTKERAKSTRSLDKIFSCLVKFINTTPTTSVCFSQGGDHIGGFDPSKKVKRKAMNSFVCSTKKAFTFIGRINEDVTTYTQLGGLGKIFFTINNLQLDQKDTQSNKGGMTDTYLIGGTYIKSFYSVIVNPSCVKVKTIKSKHTRMHHHVSWKNAVACIVDGKHKKY